MPQLHFSVDEETARRLAREAEERGLSLSRYLAGIVRRRLPAEWPPGYLDAVVGACRDAPLAEADELPLDDVELSP